MSQPPPMEPWPWMRFEIEPDPFDDEDFGSEWCERCDRPLAFQDMCLACGDEPGEEFQ